MFDPVQTGAARPVAASVSRAAKEPTTATDRTASSVPSLPRLVALAQDLSRQEPPIDYVRIAQLRAAIADGSYKVDANAIARAMQQIATPHE